MPATSARRSRRDQPAHSAPRTASATASRPGNRVCSATAGRSSRAPAPAGPHSGFSDELMRNCFGPTL
ncbi:hypothetical protein C7Y72_08525 [Paraconexibacter algicola]|uniref:Uncharacterized protein n=1 Tax=Paraconexibacter algicola TaxID=2133960 RepID=A0A2T4UKE1_9ACTN|nr:hypothetical protein C7Y72_08525 [Paraconexibacter algicola]